MPYVSRTPDRVRLDDLTDLAAAVPHLLGFHPADSVVAVALRGPRDRVSFTMRLDLPDPGDDGSVARMTAARMAGAGAEAVLLFVFTVAPPVDADLPRRPLVTAIAAELDAPVREAMLVADGRVWSYLCPDVRCCPPEGRPLTTDSPGVLALAAASALNGSAVLPDRDSVVATTRAIGGVTAASMRQAIERAGETLIGDTRAGEDLLDDVCNRLSDPHVQLTHDEAAELTLWLHDVAFRDLVISRLARGDDELDRVVADVARLAQPAYDAPAATVLAMAAYFRGDGLVAMSAAERALASDPDYSLARLVVDSLSRQLAPTQIRRIWRGDAQ